MSSNLEVLEAEVLQLAPVERTHLLERLIASLDSDPEVEEAWEREADRREAELESGATVFIPPIQTHDWQATPAWLPGNKFSTAALRRRIWRGD